MLRNRIYRREIVHKDAAYPGEHEAINARQRYSGTAARSATLSGLSAPMTGSSGRRKPPGTAPVSAPPRVILKYSNTYHLRWLGD
jgi:hypothetical protein